jgi:hypothetical protein
MIGGGNRNSSDDNNFVSLIYQRAEDNYSQSSIIAVGCSISLSMRCMIFNNR